MIILNCTPHAVNFLGDDNNIITTIQPSGIIPRVSTTISTVGDINGIPDDVTSYGEIENLPDYQDGVILIVSALIASAAKNRSDLRVPGRQVRDSQGHVIGCKSLSRPC